MSQLTQSTRQEVFDRRGHECIFCGVTGEQHKQEYNRDLDVHHVIPSRKGGSDDPENLIPVCIGCHRTIEATQGEALGQIAKEDSDPDKVSRLESKVSELEQEFQQSRENVLNILTGVDELFERNITSKIYVVHESRITTSRLLYAGGSIEDAQEAFENSDSQVTIETVNVNISEWASDLTKKRLEIIENESAILADRIRDYQEGLE